MNFLTLLEELDKLDLPKDKYAITSSGTLAIRGIRQAKDIDLVVTEDLWEELGAKYGIKEKPICDSIHLDDIEVLGNFSGENLFSVDEQIAHADIIDGRRYVSLDMIIAFKTALGREKDLKDLELIKEYIENGGK